MTKKMKTMMSAALVIAAIAVGASAQTPPPGSPVAIHGKLSVGGPGGNQIVDQHGNPIALRGMSFFWNTDGWGGEQFYNVGAVNALVDDWKVDVVRVAIDPITQPNNYVTVVNQAIAKGIYVIIDFHAHSHNLRSQAVTFFQSVSNTYKNVPNVIYEIFNEPCGEPNTDTPDKGASTNGGGGCQGDNWGTQIKPYAEAVVNAIRGNGCNNVILIGTPYFSKRVDMAAANKLTGPNATNLVYVIHFYTAESGTHHTGLLMSWSKTAYDAGLALYVSEFGISEARGDGRTDTVWANDWFDWLDARQIGWANWSINKKAESASALAGGASSDGSNWSNTSNLTLSGRFIRNKLRYYADRKQLTQLKDGNGTFTVFPDFSAPKYPDNYGYQPGTPITLTAQAEPGYTFVGFERAIGKLPDEGRDGIADNPATITMGATNRTVKAVFEKDGNIVKNGTFTVNNANWSAAGATIDMKNNELEVAITSAGSAPADVQLRQTGLDSLKAGRDYELTFRARAASNRNITVLITTSTATTIVDSQTVALTTNWQPYTIPINVRALNSNRPSFTNGALRFNAGGSNVNWYIDDVRLEDVGASVSVSQPSVSAQRTSWSAVHTTGGVQLRGPSSDVNARATLYDTRGRVVRTMSARDGLTFGKGIPSGSYMLVVRNGAGQSVLNARVMLAQ